MRKIISRMSSRGYISGDALSEAIVVSGLDVDDVFAFGGKDYMFSPDHKTIVQVEVKMEPGGTYSIVRQCGTVDSDVFVSAYHARAITKVGKLRTGGSTSGGGSAFMTKTGASVGYDPEVAAARGLSMGQVQAELRGIVTEADVRHPNTPLSNAGDALNKAGDAVGNFVNGVGNTVGGLINGIGKGAENTWNVILIVGGVVAFVAVNNLTKTTK